MWAFFILNVDKNGHFWTTYQPHFVHVVLKGRYNKSIYSYAALLFPKQLNFLTCSTEDWHYAIGRRKRGAGGPLQF